MIRRLGLISLIVAGCALAGTGLAADEKAAADQWRPLELIAAAKRHKVPFDENCAVCHGGALEGTAQGPALAGMDLVHGSRVEEIASVITHGVPDSAMPAWADALSAAEIKTIALYISEVRTGYTYNSFNIETPLEVLTGKRTGEHHDFTIETVINTLDPLPFSLALLPDGRLLVTEKLRGLRRVSGDGSETTMISGTPTAFSDTVTRGTGLEFGVGWLLDVALDPDYDENGWIYLHHTDRCSDCNALSRKLDKPVAMNRLVRGRIRNGAWVDEQVLWQADKETYGTVSNVAVGGRISFDRQGHLFFSIGMGGVNNHTGIQNLAIPYGKIHRIHTDGRVPDDNPYVGVEGALPTIWTHGHRSPQGLEYNVARDQLWGTEMGPRGGDEVNLLLPGGNYGWPLTSKGVNYDGTPVAYGEILGIEFDLADITQPVVDLTPSPAISSFIFYEGDAFPNWRGNIIVGSLKARTLYRMVLEDNQVTHREILLAGFARIRDIETAPDGTIYLLIEHPTGGQILRLVPTAAVEQDG